MDIKLQSAVQMSLVKNDREYTFLVPFGVPYDDAKLVCDEFKLGIDEMRARNEKLAAEMKSEQETQETGA